MSQQLDIKKADLLKHVKSEYDGNVGLFWQFLMGRHIHTGGWFSTADLAAKAKIAPNMAGLELCCNNGESMRHLIRYRGVKHMTGVDISPVAVARGRSICVDQGFMDKEEDVSRCRFIAASITEEMPMLKGQTFDFVWSEDSWCYIPDKHGLIAKCAQLLTAGGTLAFTDWCLGSNYKDITDEELQRFLKYMTFPNLGSVDSYSAAIKDAGLELVCAHYTGRWLPCHKLYIAMMEKQFKADLLELLGFDLNEYDRHLKEFYFMLKLAKEGKLGQGLFVAKKKGSKL